MDDILEFVGLSAGWIIGIGIAAGAAAGVAGTVDGARPLAKRAIKGYLALADRAKVAAAIVGEQAQDLYAEARMEYDAGRAE